MIRKICAALAAVCCVGAIAASGAFATSEYFYKENSLASGAKVSGTPHEGINFVGAYTSMKEPFYAIAECTGGCVTVTHFLQGNTGATTESFTPEAGFWKGWLWNDGNVAGRFTAEERF